MTTTEATTSTEVEGARLHELADKIGEEVELANRHWQDALGHAIAAGEGLIEAKSLVKHGEWLPWLEQHFPGSRSTAAGYMRMARKCADVAHLTTVSEAIAALTTPKPKKVPPPMLDGVPLTDAQVRAANAHIAIALEGGESTPRLPRLTVQIIVALAEWRLEHFEHTAEGWRARA